VSGNQIERLESSLGNGLKSARPDSVTEQENTHGTEPKNQSFSIETQIKIIITTEFNALPPHLIENQHEFLAHF
jgi:hypothetical protein